MQDVAEIRAKLGICRECLNFQSITNQNMFEGINNSRKIPLERSGENTGQESVHSPNSEIRESSTLNIHEIENTKSLYLRKGPAESLWKGFFEPA